LTLWCPSDGALLPRRRHLCLRLMGRTRRVRNDGTRAARGVVQSPSAHWRLSLRSGRPPSKSYWLLCVDTSLSPSRRHQPFCSVVHSVRVTDHNRPELARRPCKGRRSVAAMKKPPPLDRADTRERERQCIVRDANYFRRKDGRRRRDAMRNGAARPEWSYERAAIVGRDPRRDFAAI
jgi:hypothetical protein